MELFAYLFGIIQLFLCFCDNVGHTIEMKEDDFKPLFKTAASEFSHHEVVKPLIFKGDEQMSTSRDKTGHHSQLTIKFHTKDNEFIIDLVRNRNLFSKAYVEKSMVSEHDYKMKKPHHKKLKKHCFYHGHVRGAPDSMVALSTCNGISGYIQTGRQVFHIEPAFDIDKQSHRLYRDDHSLGTHHNCGAHHSGRALKLNDSLHIEHKNDILRRGKRSIIQPYDANINTRYVEMYIVNDFRTFDSNGRNEQYQIRKTQNIVNIVSRLYQPFNIYIALVGIENWMETDLFTITTEADTTLENFLHYRKSRINPKHQNDNAQLITDTTFGNGVVGKAIKGTICTFQYSGGVNLNLATEGQTATTIAHELGHNFGMDHDNYTICQCKEEKCIMAATSGGINTPIHWSSCSMLALQEAFEMGMDYCLRNMPEQLYEGPVCGNSFTEEGEECDCGLPEDCANKCCNASTCKLTTGSLCATGACCDLNKCKPKSAATLCRASVGDCDLPEFCLGHSPNCPADVFLLDGTECYNGGQSYCYNGQCRTHTGQCRLLWGSTGRVSDPVCFKHLNSNGSKHGNCGYNWTRHVYEPCQRENVMCGLLHCVHQNEKLMFWKDNLAHATPATFLTIGPQTYVCRGAMLDVGLDMPDPGMVPDGAKCDDKKICVDQKCTALSSFKFPGCSDGCSDRGVCNSKGHCHCEEGWGGHTCDESGNGGSIDSGPIKINDDKSLLITLLVLFLVVLPLLGVLTFIAYYFRANILAWWHNKFSFKHKGQKRPLRPAHPPPKPDHSPVRKPPPPPAPSADNKPLRPQQQQRPNNNNNNRPGLHVKVSDPVLTGTTHGDTKTHVKPSPVPNHKPVIPKPPQKPVKQTSMESNREPKNETPSAEKSRFAPIFKIPSFSKSDKQGAQNNKPEVNKMEELPVANIVKKRELTRNISNPVLISTTDRRSKHLVKLENLNVNQAYPDSDDSEPPPPVPPKISLGNEYENTVRRNRPLPVPPRPMSMPESECGDETEISGKGSRKSAVIATQSTQSPRMPQRPPPPPIKPNVDNTRKMLEDELSKLDDINVEFPRGDTPDRPFPSPLVKPKNLKPKPRVTASKSADVKTGSSSKPVASKTKSDIKPEKPIFNPKARPGLSPKNSDSKNLKPAEPTRKPSTDSLEDDPNAGAASVAGLAQRFEVQKKPLLSDRNVKRTQSQNTAKVPMTPPKPRSGAKQVRSVDV